MLKDLKTDIDRYIFNAEINAEIDLYKFGTHYFWLLTLLARQQGLWILCQYRFSRWVQLRVKTPFIRAILKLLSLISRLLVQIFTNSEFPNTSEIGKGMFIPHGSGIIIHYDAKIGEYCNLGHQVTIGLGGRGEKAGVPTIGDRVFIGPGAKIIGKITIGNDVAIGTNAVVTKDLPDNAVAVGIPAKIISYKGSQDFIDYREKHCNSVQLINLTNRQ